MEREKGQERKEEIIVLDEGVEVEDMAGPKGLCCRGAFFAFRG